MADNLSDRPVNDYDIFVVNSDNSDVQECIDRALMVLLNELTAYQQYIVNVYMTASTNVIQIELYVRPREDGYSPFHITSNGVWRTVKLQIIKRVYRSLPEIFVGFDLDASCAAYANLDGITGIYGCDHFLLAYRHGVNVVCPFRQSETYGYRLNKYMSKGFVPLVPDAIHLKNTNLSSVVWTGDYKQHQLSELIALQSQNSVVHVKQVSDYDEIDYDIIKSQGLFSEERLDRAEQLNLKPIGILYQGKFFVDYGFVHDNMLTNEQLLDLVQQYGASFYYVLRQSKYHGETRYYFPFFSTDLLMSILSLTGNLSGWRVTNPNSQITSSFHPTDYDYLSGWNVINKVTVVGVDDDDTIIVSDDDVDNTIIVTVMMVITTNGGNLDYCSY